jgi:hypothetical protein
MITPGNAAPVMFVASLNGRGARAILDLPEKKALDIPRERDHSGNLSSFGYDLGIQG